MGMLDWLFRRHDPVAEAKAEAIREMTRNWQSAANDRILAGSFEGMTDQRINEDIRDEKDTLQARCRYERQNNGWVTGMVESYVTDVVGRNGPRLQISEPGKDVSQFGQMVEAVWNDWWAMPDLSRIQSGVELLGTGIRTWMDTGDMFFHLTGSRSTNPGVNLRVQALAPERCETPPEDSLSEYVSNGVAFTQEWAPSGYWFRQETPSENSFQKTFDHKKISAGNMIHFYVLEEVGQSRGVPRLAPVLGAASQLSAFEKDTMQAARMAAMLAILLESDDPNNETPPIKGSMEMERGSMTAVPPGYRVKQVTPQHPSTIYLEFVNHKLAQMGRPFNMPGMVVRLDSSGHNFSSARFDGQTYDRSIKAFQGMLERVILNRLLGRVMREATLAGMLPTGAPQQWNASWVWPVRPHVDPTKEANANYIKLRAGVISQAGWAASDGEQIEDIQSQRKREGLPLEPDYVMELENSDQPSAEVVDGQSDDDDDQEQDQDQDQDRSNWNSYRSSTILMDDDGTLYVEKGGKAEPIGGAA